MNYFKVTTHLNQCTFEKNFIHQKYSAHTTPQNNSAGFKKNRDATYLNMAENQSEWCVKAYLLQLVYYPPSQAIVNARELINA
jgi:hypothetical protein